MRSLIFPHFLLQHRPSLSRRAVSYIGLGYAVRGTERGESAITSWSGESGGVSRSGCMARIGL